MSARVNYEEVPVKSVLHAVKGMPFQYSINPYRGCVHSCHYCFARRYHAFLDLNADEDFTSIIVVKKNAPEVLRQELARRRGGWEGVNIALGTGTDPYQPIEGKQRTTRGILAALRDFRVRVGVITKGTMAVRDADILADAAWRGRCSVAVSITTMDEGVWARLEPGTPPPRSRMRAVERLAAAGVRVGVVLAPVVPGVTDSEASILAVAESAGAAGAHFLDGRPLYLMPGTKEHFTSYLALEEPHLLRRYQTMYAGAYPPQDYSRRIEGLIAQARGLYGLDRRFVAEPERERARQLPLAV
jgi:DNA repair photolyase